MDIKHRKMEKSDIVQVLEFFSELHSENAQVSFSEVEKREEIENWLNDKSIYTYVSENQGEVLGVFRAKRGDSGREHACFLTAAVTKKYRGYKVAQKLTNFSLEELKKEGVKIARAYVYSNNPASFNTLLKCGFSFNGCVHMHHFDAETNSYVDDLIFHKIL